MASMEWDLPDLISKSGNVNGSGELQLLEYTLAKDSAPSREKGLR